MFRKTVAMKAWVLQMQSFVILIPKEGTSLHKVSHAEAGLQISGKIKYFSCHPHLSVKIALINACQLAQRAYSLFSNVSAIH